MGANKRWWMTLSGIPSVMTSHTIRESGCYINTVILDWRPILSVYPCVTSLHVFLPTLCNYILKSYQDLNLDRIVRSDKFFQLNYKTNCTSEGIRTLKTRRLRSICIPVPSRRYFGCKDGTAPSSQDPQSCTSLKSFEHHVTIYKVRSPTRAFSLGRCSTKKW